MNAHSSKKVKFDKGHGNELGEVRTITVPEHLSWILERLGWDLEHYSRATVTIYLETQGNSSYRITGDDSVGR